MIWDDHQGRCIGELNFRTQVIIFKEDYVDAGSAVPPPYLMWSRHGMERVSPNQ